MVGFRDLVGFDIGPVSKKLDNELTHTHYTLPTAEILSGKNERAFLVCGFLMKSYKKILKI
jgi:hypothetical protein